ncbi:MAG: hypothetical protein IJ266_04485, partial [Elusimicrobiaceae bacterium]|nr:hypothetical protein [Elusimicrobiaceae bacterium]
MFNLSTWFSLFVAVYVIFNRYASPIPYITLSEFILLLFWGMFIISHPKKIHIEWCLVPFCIYLLGYVIVPFTGFIPYVSDMTDLVGTAARLLFIYVSITILGKNLFNIEKGIKFIHWVAIILAVYACLQILAAKFGIYLTTYLPFLPVVGGENIDTVIQNRTVLYGLAFRASSLLTEPAHLCTYLAAALGLELFSSSRKNRFMWALFFSSVSLLTLSSTGLVVTLLIWGLFFLQNPKVSIKKFSGGVLVASVGILLSC